MKNLEERIGALESVIAQAAAGRFDGLGEQCSGFAPGDQLAEERVDPGFASGD